MNNNCINNQDNLIGEKSFSADLTNHIIDLNAILPLIENISGLCNVSCELIDMRGKLLLSSVTQGICEKFHRTHPVTLANCKRNHHRIIQISIEKGNEEFTCQNGLTEIVIPLHIHGMLLGAFFLGPFYMKKNENLIAAFQNQEFKYGFDEKEYSRELASIEVLSEERSGFLINVFTELTNVIKSFALRDRAIANEVNEREKQKIEIFEVKKQAEESDKLKAAFLANMSHEIRTPMNSIIGFSELMSRENLDKEDKLSYMSIIKESGRTLLELIDDIIDVSHIEANLVAINKREFNVAEMLTEVYQIFAEQAAVFNKSHIVLLLEQSFTGPVMLCSDRLRVKQVLSNLLRNAYKFSEKGPILFGCRKEADELVFYVKDSGIGISKEQQDFIFERFRQGDNNLNRKFGGAGLGLSIARDLCLLLGGRIWFDSELNSGSIFCFSLKYESNNSDPEPGNLESQLINI